MSGASALDRLYSGMVRRVLLPVGDRLTGQRIASRLAFLEQAQWWEPEQVDEVQRQRLQELIRVAYAEVPVYRDGMDARGVRPQDVREVADLQKLPVLEKQLLRDGYPDRTTRKTPFRSVEVSSSGSTGQNTRVLEDSETSGQLRALIMLGFTWSGWPIGARHLQTGMTTKRGGVRAWKDRVFRCEYISAFDMSNEAIDRALATIRRQSIRHLRGYAGSLYLLAQRARETGFDWRMQSVATWGDNLYVHYRKALEEAFGCRVFDLYGCAEGIYVAAQCGHEDHYHSYGTDVVVEIVDDEGRPSPPGETGNVLLTRLHPGATPLIRYRVGDIARQPTGERCPCGRGFPMFGPIQGRDTDIVVTPSGNRLLVHFFTGLLEHFAEIDAFQVVQEELSSITLKIVPRPGFGPEVQERAVKTLLDHGAGELRIDVEIVDEIPLPPSQKRRFVVSRLSTPAGPA